MSKKQNYNSVDDAENIDDDITAVGDAENATSEVVNEQPVVVDKLKELQDQMTDLRKIIMDPTINAIARQDARDKISLIKKKIMNLPAGTVSTKEVHGNTVSQKVYVKCSRLSDSHYII